jgi:heat-inducible transcriptional repressor
LEGGGVRVWIGADSDLTSELDFSLVATTYGLGDRPLGTLGILGPSRMEYEKVIPLVDFLGEALSRALGETLGGRID